MLADHKYRALKKKYCTLVCLVGKSEKPNSENQITVGNLAKGHRNLFPHFIITEAAHDQVV